MKKKIFYSLILIYSYTFSIESLPNVNSILENYISALDGESHLNKLHSYRISGSLLLNDTIIDVKSSTGRHGWFIFEGALPHSYRLEEIIDTMMYIDNHSNPAIAPRDTIINASNGENNFDPNDQSADNNRIIPDSIECNSLACPLGPLYYAWSKKLKVNLVDTHHQKHIIKLKIPFKSGRYFIIYLDAKSFYELRRDYIRGEVFRVTKIKYSSHKTINDLLFPTSWQEMFYYYPIQCIYNVNNIEINIPIDNSRFVVPKKNDD